ncbi:MAG: DUF1835 domain-containing protein [Candidatus Baltobacteraceae bacterium]
MSVNGLHITNGDSVLYLWKKCGLLGTHVAWRDVLHEGPVPAGLSVEQMSRVRANYLISRGYGNPIKINHDFEKRDATVRQAARFDEIVLWFEHDLYDQLQLLQVLGALRAAGIGAGRVELVQSDHYLGLLTADELMALYPKRKFVTAATEQGAAKAWSAFTAADPHMLLAAADEKYPGLPFMRDGLRRLCEEYPALDTGLSRTQKQVLDACAQGARKKEEIFARSQSREEASFLADSASFATIDDLCSPPAPLLVPLDLGYEVTVLGRRIIAGDADWLEQQPLDRWIGGVHLRTQSHWRWDERQETLLARRTTVET